MAVRAPHLHLTLRAFCLGSFVFLGRALEEGDDLPFAFEEHVQRQGPALYEYRPLVRSFVESRANALAKRDDARIALDELLREPAAAIFARAHAGPKPTEEQALFRTVLLSLLISTAESCGGFDWDDRAFERAYAELEGSLFGGQHAYAAVAPLVGLSVVTQVELGGGIRLRAAATGELAHHWPEAQGLLPAGFGREVDRYCVIELERGLEPGEEPPDAPAELADAVSAIRLATAAPVAAGPVLFERLDWRPFGIRPVLPIAATQPPGEATRLDSFRAEVTREVLERLALADADAPLAEALDRWELSLFQNEPFRSEQLRGALDGPARRDVGAARRRAPRRRQRGAARDPLGAALARRRRAGIGASRGHGAAVARRDAPARRSGLARPLARRRAAGAARRGRCVGRRFTFP